MIHFYNKMAPVNRLVSSGSNVTFILSTAAVCLPDTIVSARNPAIVTPSGQVQLGQTVTLTCIVPGRPVFNNTRYCVYYQGAYQLVGADYDCGCESKKEWWWWWRWWWWWWCW